MEQAQPVTACETHLSEVFLGSDRVYKRLKPVKLPFIDLSTVERRCAEATREFRRNHAISPLVYLGTADVVEHGQVVDRLIVMRRLADNDQLDATLAAGEPGDLAAIARRVANLHLDSAELREGRAAPASAEAVSRHWEDNFATMEPFVGSLFDPSEFQTVKARARTWLAGRQVLLRDRIDAGWVRDGHGDLRAEHVYCTPDGVELIDCLAFDDSLRVSDMLSDIAFLAMDVERLAGPVQAAELMRLWGELTGEHHPSSLAHFYVAYRAHVRAKVAALQFAQHRSAARANEAQRYHRLALRHLDLARVRLVLVGGGPGTGKSTVAERVATAIGAAWIRADEVRKDLAGLAHTDHAFAAADAGIYTPEMSRRTYEEMRRRAELLLTRGISVVLDATWRQADERAHARELGSTVAAKLTELRCELPAAIAKERIARRMASIYEPSDATPELVDVMAERFDPWPEASAVSTNQPVEASVSGALDALTEQHRRVPKAAEAGPRFADQVTRLREFILISGGLPVAPVPAHTTEAR